MANVEGDNKKGQMIAYLECSKSAPFSLDQLENPNEVFCKFFKAHRCYDLIPTSSKLVVFDTQLNVKKAFFALVYNGVRAAPLWDSQKQQFAGMLTITDFITMLHKNYKSPNVRMEEIEEHKIQTWRDALARDKPFISIASDESLLKAVRMLIENRVHRLPVVDRAAGNVLYILTHKRLLKFLFLYIAELPLPDYMDKPISELVGIGTFRSVANVHEQDMVANAINTFVETRVSALPVLDANDRLVDIYSKFDVINLAAEGTYNNLDQSVRNALSYRKEVFEGVLTCKPTENLRTVITRIVEGEVHRLVVVDDDMHVVGVVSLSDLLYFLVLLPANEARARKHSAGPGNSTGSGVGTGSQSLQSSGKSSPKNLRPPTPSSASVSSTSSQSPAPPVSTITLLSQGLQATTLPTAQQPARQQTPPQPQQQSAYSPLHQSASQRPKSTGEKAKASVSPKQLSPRGTPSPSLGYKNKTAGVDGHGAYPPSGPSPQHPLNRAPRTG